MTLQDCAAAMTVNGIRVEVVEKGRGRPLLFLHPGIGLDPNAPVIDKLAEGARLIAPSHPGLLLCYKSKSSSGFGTLTAHINNQFGPDDVTLIHRRELCVPSVQVP